MKDISINSMPIFVYLGVVHIMRNQPGYFQITVDYVIKIFYIYIYSADSSNMSIMFLLIHLRIFGNVLTPFAISPC